MPAQEPQQGRWARVGAGVAALTLVAVVAGCSSSSGGSPTTGQRSTGTLTAITAGNIGATYQSMQQAAAQLGDGTCQPSQSAHAANITVPAFFAQANQQHVQVIACVLNQYNGIELFYTDPPSAPTPCATGRSASSSTDCVSGVYGANFVITDIENPDQRGACVALHQISGIAGTKTIDDAGKPVLC